MDIKAVRKTLVVWFLTITVFWFLYQGFARIYERLVDINTTANIVAFFIVIGVILPASVFVRNWMIAVLCDEV